LELGTHDLEANTQAVSAKNFVVIMKDGKIYKNLTLRAPAAFTL